MHERRQASGSSLPVVAPPFPNQFDLVSSISVLAAYFLYLSCTFFLLPGVVYQCVVHLLGTFSEAIAISIDIVRFVPQLLDGLENGVIKFMPGHSLSAVDYLPPYDLVRL